MTIIVFLASLLASTIGSISGIGGGVLLRPVLDALGTFQVSAVSFLSTITVFSMSCVALFQRHRMHAFAPDRRSGFLAAGAALGGVLGQQAFSLLKSRVGNDPLVGLVQSIVLASVVTGTMIYTLFARDWHPKKQATTWPSCSSIGMVLGALSAFLGIGGGPMNLVVLRICFDMDTQHAASNSLLIICLSQITNMLVMLLRSQIPHVSGVFLTVMITAGVFGGQLGSVIHRRLNERQNSHLFCAIMVLVIAICVYNASRFAANL